MLPFATGYYLALYKDAKTRIAPVLCVEVLDRGDAALSTGPNEPGP